MGNTAGGIGSRLFALFAVIGFAAPAFQTAAEDAAGARDYRLGEAPKWVEIADASYSAGTPGSGVDSTYFLLVDHQIDVRARGNEQFDRYAVRLLNDAGAEDQSQQTLYVNPAFQRLTLHWIRVYRNGGLHDRLPQTRITVLPVETELQNRIYNGEQSVNLLIPDLRAGDVLDYAYTIESVDPNFPGHFAASLRYSWGEPAHSQRIRVRHRRQDRLHYKVHGGSAEPVVRDRDGIREVTFSWRDTPARPSESGVPGWHPHWAYVQFSNMRSWGELAATTAEMYRRESSAGPRLRARIDSIRSLPGSVEDRVLAAVKFVQDEIRYASISIGAGSYRPNPADVVLERNFGDCKDKSLLVSNLLRAVGIDAKPALVHTWRGRALPDVLPSPYAFDHAIVRVSLGDRVLWIDPTASMQGGALAELVQADYEHALVIDPGTTGLEKIPPLPADVQSRETRMTFDLRKGVREPATLEVKTRVTGKAADSLRSDLARRDRVQRETDYLNFYASYYPEIAVAAPLTIEDDRKENAVVTQESYRLTHAFREQKPGKLAFTLYPDELYDYSNAPETSIRTAPLSLSYPVKVSQSFEVRLPEPWSISEGTFVIDNPAFRYRSKVRYEKQVLTAEFQYEALADHVAVADLPRYLADIKRMSDDLGIELTYAESIKSLSRGVAPYPVAAALLGLLAGLWGARRLWRYDPPERAGETLPGTAGISGWLLLPALHVILVPLMMGALVYSLTAYLGSDTWNGLPDTTPAFMRPWVQHGVAAFLAASLFLLPAYTVTSVLFFRKRTSAPVLLITVYWVAVVFGAAAGEYFNALAPGEQPAFERWGQTAGEAFATALWTAYLLASRRVRATFVARLRPQ